MTSFATPAELASAMGHETFQGASLVRAEEMLAYASALIRLVCDTDLEPVAGAQEEHAADASVRTIFLQHRPVTAITSITIDGAAFADFEGNYLTGTVSRTDGGAWSEGPILITYDHGYAAASDEMAAFKAICIEVAARSITKETEPFATMGEGVREFRGGVPQIFLTQQEIQQLASYGPVPVG